jgi:hypothetical protein
VLRRSRNPRPTLVLISLTRPSPPHDFLTVPRVQAIVEHQVNDAAEAPVSASSHRGWPPFRGKMPPRELAPIKSPLICKSVENVTGFRHAGCLCAVWDANVGRKPKCLETLGKMVLPDRIELSTSPSITKGVVQGWQSRPPMACKLDTPPVSPGWPREIGPEPGAIVGGARQARTRVQIGPRNRRAGKPEASSNCGGDHPNESGARVSSRLWRIQVRTGSAKRLNPKRSNLRRDAATNATNGAFCIEINEKLSRDSFLTRCL